MKPRVIVTPIDLQINWGKLVNLHHDSSILNSVGLSSPPKNSFFRDHKTRIQQEQLSNSPITTYQVTLIDNTFIGFIMLCPIPKSNKAEISYMIAPDFQHKGYGKMAVYKLCREILLQQTHTIVLWALVSPRNTASQKILSFCGFRVKDDPNLLDYEDMEYELTIN